MQLNCLNRFDPTSNVQLAAKQNINDEKNELSYRKRTYTTIKKDIPNKTYYITSLFTIL